MPLIDVPTAKRELRVTHSEEDADIERKIAAAEEQATLFLGRAVYVTQEELTAAIAAAPATLAAASTAYDAAIEAAGALTNTVERTLAERAAKDTYNDAMFAYQRTMRGMVANDSVLTAVLLTTASLWEHRGDEVELDGVPLAARSFLWPFRVGIGI